ncbi:MAG: hypothetical protein ACXV5N_12620 [Halobacteriota archaeon]
MSKTIRLTDDVYAALKSRSVKKGKTLSETVYALLEDSETESRISAVEIRISELESLLLSKEHQKPTLKQKTKGRGRDSNPRRGLHSSFLI